MKDASIGVFDSGMGGLTVLRALHEHLPHEHFIYLGDTARLPYGTKSVATVISYAIKMSQILINRGIKLLVIACNTATVSAIDVLQKAYPEIPVIGVIMPAAMAAVAHTKKNRVGVLATETTVRSHIYESKITSLNQSISVYTKAAGLFVALAEEGLINGPIVNEAISYYLSDLIKKNIDVLVLGCTHFPVLEKAIRGFIPSDITVVNSAKFTAKKVQSVLDEKGLLLKTANQKNKSEFLVSDLPERFCRVGEIFLGRKIDQSEVELI